MKCGRVQPDRHNSDNDEERALLFAALMTSYPHFFVADSEVGGYSCHHLCHDHHGGPLDTPLLALYHSDSCLDPTIYTEAATYASFRVCLV